MGREQRRSGSFCNERESLPPPDDLAVFGLDVEKSAGGIWSVFDELQDPGAVFGRSRGSFEIPVQVRLFERGDKRMPDLQPGGLAKI